MLGIAGVLLGSVWECHGPSPLCSSLQYCCFHGTLERGHMALCLYKSLFLLTLFFQDGIGSELSNTGTQLSLYHNGPLNGTQCLRKKRASGAPIHNRKELIAPLQTDKIHVTTSLLSTFGSKSEDYIHLRINVRFNSSPSFPTLSKSRINNAK